MSELIELEYAELSTTGLSLKPSCTIEQAAELLSQLEVRQDSGRWRMGDLMLELERYPGEGSQVLDGWNADTLRQYRWLAKSIPRDLRHIEIPYRWYRLIAKLEYGVQKDLVERALAESWGWLRWNAEASEARGEVPKQEAPTRKERARAFSRSMVGRLWTEQAAEELERYL